MNWRRILAVFTLADCLSFPLSAQVSAPGAETNGFEIRRVMVAGDPVPLAKGGEVNLGAFPKAIFIGFGPITNAGPGPIRIRHRMEGFENGWHEGGGDMFLAVRYFNDEGDQILQKNFPVHGQSAGWNCSLDTSPLTHRREALVVPPRAASVWIVISSAGPPSTVGVYVVADLVVSKSSGDPPFAKLIQLTFDHQPDDESGDQPPPGWTRDGNHAGMAKIVKYGVDPATRALAILDDDPMSHAEWHIIKEAAPSVTPGEHLLIEWNEMYNMGVGDYRSARYATLPPGTFQFTLEGVDMMGKPTDVRTTLAIVVPQPYWRTLLFWCVTLIMITAISIGGGRYWVRRKMRLEMVRLKNAQSLEQERLRIAHDIHDDLGARVTQISLVSAMAQNNLNLPEKARADFDRISQMSRELVSALYETVWAVNPENDNLEALGNYLCQIANQFCEPAKIRCRVHISELPREIQVSSQTRHNISMAVKEAVHNAIKHAGAAEIAVHMGIKDGVLTISVQDDGSGFKPPENLAGNGLRNMKQRLESIGGTCTVESTPGQGTVIRLRLVMQKRKK